MLRRLLLVVISGTCVYIFGQAVNSGATAGTGNAAVPAGTYVVNGYVTTIGNGQVVTPTAAFDTPAPTSGISDSGRAGISNNAPLANGALSVTPPSSIAFTSAAPVVANSVPAEGNPGQAAVPANQASAIGDFGPSYFAGNESAASTNGSVSLAEMATQYKSQAARSSHTYTNADIEQIAGKNSGIVLTNNTRTISLPSGEASGNAQTAQNTRPNPQSAAPQTPGQSATQPGAAVSQENPNSATTPRINQPQPGTREGETRTLPATATLLPLLGLIGVLTGGLGLLFRRSSR